MATASILRSTPNAPPRASAEDVGDREASDGMRLFDTRLSADPALHREAADDVVVPVNFTSEIKNIVRGGISLDEEAAERMEQAALKAVDAGEQQKPAAGAKKAVKFEAAAGAQQQKKEAAAKASAPATSATPKAATKMPLRTNGNRNAAPAVGKARALPATARSTPRSKATSDAWGNGIVGGLALLAAAYMLMRS